MKNVRISNRFLYCLLYKGDYRSQRVPSNNSSLTMLTRLFLGLFCILLISISGFAQTSLSPDATAESVSAVVSKPVAEENSLVNFPAVSLGMSLNPRDRERVLQKQNPMASEYQSVGGVGVVSFSNADAEGVNYHGKLPSGGKLEGPTSRIKTEASYHYGQLSDAGLWQGYVSVDQLFGQDKRWALSFLLDTQAADLAFERIYTRWGTIDLPDGSEQNVIERLNTGRRTVHSRRKSFSGVLEHALSDNHTLYFKTSLRQTEDSDIAQRLEMRFADGEYESVSDFSAFSRGASVKREMRVEPERTDIYRFEGGGKFENDDWVLQYSMYYSQYERGRPDLLRVEFRREDVDMSYNREDVQFPQRIIHSDIDIYDPNEMPFRELRDRSSLTVDEDYAGDINFHKRFNFSKVEMEIFAGSLYRQKERINKDERLNYEVFNGTYNLSETVVPKEPDLIAEDHYRLGRGADPFSTHSFFINNFDDFELDFGRSRSESDPNNFRSFESVKSFYLMQRIKSLRWYLNAGFRFEKTKIETDGNTVITEVVGDDDVYVETIPVSNKNEYNNSYFSLEFVYLLNEQINLRAAAFETLARPNYFDLVPFRQVFNSSEFIREGNPNLQSTEYTNFIVGADFKNPWAGKLSAVWYYKDIKNYFFQGEFFVRGGPNDGFKISRPENGDEAQVWGLEVGWNRNIPLFPQSFGKATASVFYIFSNSEAFTTKRPGETLLLPERAGHMLEVAILNEIRKLKTRLSLSFQSKSLDNVAETTNADEYLDHETIISFSSKYQLHPNMNFFLDFFNISEQPQNSFEGNDLRPSDRIFGSWRTRVGINIAL